MTRIPLLAAALVLAACAAVVAAQPASVGDRVVEFCKKHHGKRVGNGECTTLAVAALRSAGARTHGPLERNRNANGDPVDTDGFNWGQRVFVLEREGGNFKTTGQIQDVRRGDIIQYRNVRMTGTQSDFESYTLSARQHTAIVAAIEDNGASLKVYQQNSNGHKVVTAMWLHLTDLQQGRLTIYHPIPRTQNGSPDQPPVPDR